MPRPGRDREEFFDATPSAPRGFALRVSVRGAAREPVRTWTLCYRIARRKRWLALGDARSITLADARELGHAALRRVESGDDPAAERERLRESDTFAALVSNYIERGAAGRSARTNENYRRQRRALAKSPLGKMAAPAVTRADVRAHVEALAVTAPVQARRVLALVRAACRWATGRDLLPADPTAGLTAPEAKAPERRRLDDDEVKALWLALDSPDAGLATEVVAAVRVLLLLGTRRSETCSMRWRDLDLEAKPALWTIPAADRKGGRALAVPLAPAVVSIIEALPRRGVFVFAGKRGGPLNSNPARWSAAVRAASGVTFSPHALRRTFARGVAKLGASSELVSRLLGHKLAAGALAVTEGYSEYDFLPERAAVLASWAAHVARVVAGDERKGADVVPFATKASA
jgi:integrase